MQKMRAQLSAIAIAVALAVSRERSNGEEHGRNYFIKSFGFWVLGGK